MIRLVADKLKGKVKIPPSKSLLHRALVLASFSKKAVKIHNVNYSNDILATISCLENLGIKMIKENDSITILPSLIHKVSDINAGESGTTLRFMIPYALLQDEEITIDGKNRLKVRPIDDYFPMFEENKVEYVYHDSLPLKLKGRLKAGTYYLKGNVSSQFISGLMLTLPFVKGDSKIIITTKLESKPYVDMTIKICHEFGVEIKEDGNTYYIKGDQEVNISEYYVEGDYSQAAFFLVANALGSEIELEGLRRSNMQGDEQIITILENLGVTFDDKFRAVKRDLHSGVISLAQNPDLAPILGVLASNIKGETKLVDLERLAYKESNRLESTLNLLKCLNVKAEAINNALIISGPADYKVIDEVKSYNDHRIVMSSAIMATLSKEVLIDDIKPVNKSFPNFFTLFVKLGGKVYE